ncbi:transcriptional regulator XRE family [Coprobacillus sp. CAG:605]|nr:transcriptional regulator XRE family [Coprobacillus sp. CAG:605]
MNEIGCLLKSARETSGVSLEEASADLKIRPAVLNNIEEGNMGCFKDIFELKDYIREYSKYLGMNPDKMVDEFNEYMFEATSKIPVKEIENQIKEKNKMEATGEIRIMSPYTDNKSRYKTKNYLLLYLLVIVLVALVIFWSVKQITIGNTVTTIASSVK